MQVTVDRIEEDYIVLELENGNIIDVPKDRKIRESEVKKLMDDLFVD